MRHDAPQQFLTCSKQSFVYTDHLRFVQSHGDALTNVLRMYHGLLRFIKSWKIGTKDRDSVTDAYNPSTSTVDRRNLATRGQLQRRQSVTRRYRTCRRRSSELAARISITRVLRSIVVQGTCLHRERESLFPVFP